MANSKDFIVKNGIQAGANSSITGTLAAGNTSITGTLSTTGNTAVTGNLTVNTVTAGAWNGSVIAGQYGGTGVNNSGKTITLGGNITTANSLTTSGNFATTLTVTAATNVTLPTTGTLATLAGSETLTNKTLTSPTMTTPILGVASATSINKVTITAPTTGSTLTIANGKTATINNTLTFNGTDSSTVAFGSGGTVAYTANKLSAFAATTSAELAGVISDETGSGNLVFSSSASLTSPTISGGALSGTFTGSPLFSGTISANNMIVVDTGTGVYTDGFTLRSGTIAAGNPGLYLKKFSATAFNINGWNGTAVEGSLALTFPAGITASANLSVGSVLSVTGNTSIGGNLTVTGNLTINGTTTTVNSTTVTLDDPILTLGGDTAPTVDDNKDRGIEFRWHNGTVAKSGFFGFDDSTGYFTFIPDATNTSEVFSGTKGILDATALLANNASYLGGTIASGYQTTAGLSANVATLTANNASYLGGTIASGYQTTAGLSANVATLTANNSTYLNGQLASYYTNATNISTGTLAVARGGTGVTTSTGSGSVVLSAGPTFTGNTTFDTDTLFIDSVNDRVGIGTTTPGSALGIVSGSISRTGTTNLSSWANNTGGYIQVTGTVIDTGSIAGSVIERRPLVLFSGATIDSTNALTVNNASTMTIAGAPSAGTNTSINYTHAIYIASGRTYMAAGGSVTAPMLAIRDANTGLYSSATGVLNVTTSGTKAASFYANGNFEAVGDVTAYSDERLKSNIRTIDNALDKVSRMRGVYFTKNGNASTGVIAQEIEKVLPEVVVNGSEFKSVAYGNIIGVLIEAIKELQDKINKLENRG